MANKKVFSIEINGLTESVRTVDALTEKLNALQAQINKMKKQGIEVPIEVGGDELIKEIQNISSKVKKATKGSLPLAEEKEYIKALKDRQRQLEAVNKELGDTGKNLREYKQETKELVAQETKARNEAKTYANTLNGLKAELKDLNNIKGNLDLNSEEYAEVSQQILQLTTRLKEYEAAQGSYGRNVGNYTNSIREATSGLQGLREETEMTAEEIQRLDEVIQELAKSGTNNLIQNDLDKYSITIDQVRQRMDQLNKLKNASQVGSEEYKEWDRLLDATQKVNNELKRLQGTIVKADNQLQTQLQRTINGTTYTWETLTAAVGELEDKLYQLAANGQRNTAEFEAIAQAASELKIQLRQVDYEIDSMVESSKGMQKMVTYSQGFAAIAQGTQGISQLFGMSDEDALKGIQTLQSLQSIAMALQTVKELSRKDRRFGEIFEDIDRGLNNVLGRLGVFRDEYPKAMETARASVESFNKTIQSLDTKELSRFGSMVFLNPDVQNVTIQFTKTLRSEYDILVQKIKTFADIEVKSYKELLALEKQFATSQDENISQLADDIYNFKQAAKGASQGVLSLRDAGLGLTGVIANVVGHVKTFIRNIRGIRGETENVTMGVLNMTKGLRMAVVGMEAAITAAKALRAALKAFIIFEVINFVFKAVDQLIEWGKAAYVAATGNDKLVDSVTTLESRLNTLNSAVENYIEKLERLNAANKLSDIDKVTKQYSALQKAMEEATKQLKEFVELRGQQKKLEDNFSDDGLTQTWDFKSLEQFRTEYEKLLKAVESGTDVKQQGGSWWDKLWYTKKDAKSDLGVMQKRVIEDIQYRINNLDLSKGTEELEAFFNIMDEEMYKSSIENIENLFPEEEWASVLKRRLESLRDFFKQVKKAGDDVTAQAEQRAKVIRDNYTEALEKEQERERKALRDQMDDEIKAAKGDQELILSIRAKYQRLEEEMLKKHNEAKLNEIKQYEADLTNILRQIRDNYLSTENESLAKTLKTINNERKDALEDAKKTQEEQVRALEKLGKDTTEITETYKKLEASINAKYDNEIEKEKEEYYKNLLEQYDKYQQELIKVQQGLKSDALDTKSQRIDIEYTTKSNTSDGSYNWNDRLNSEKQFNANRLALELDYLNKKKQMDDEYARFDKDDALLQEEDRYNKALQSLEEFKKSGNATEEEYNNLLIKERELHLEHLNQIDARYKSQLEVREAEHQNEIKQTISAALRDQVSVYEMYSQQVADIMSEVGQEQNIFGITKYVDTKKDLEKALDIVKEGITSIDKEIVNLDNQRKEGKISFVDWKDATEQLQNTKKGLEKEGKNITKLLDNLLGDVAGQWKSMIDQWVNAVSSLLQTLNDTQMQLIENQMAEIDHQLEIQQEAYDRAEEAAEEHKNKMDAIEDELSEARGARRQFLIDTLAAQQAAYLEDLAAQQKAAEEKEKLEKKQKALEKQRKEQEKKANVQQAIINTYMAVSNALAVQPWFVGAALSAVALAMGLKNVSAIKNTPIYEDGGVISGPRHSQGGVKVLGGTAEVEGGEYITNRKSTAANLPLLTYINDQKREVTAEDLLKFFASNTPKVRAKATRMFADGGQLPSIGAEVNRVVQVNDASNESAVYVVQVTDIINATENLRKVQTLSGLYNE